MQTSTILTYLAATWAAVSAITPPSLCIVSPVPTVTAGDPLIATVDNPQGGPCEATLVFSNQDFLPVSFALQPMDCLGFQQAEISVPPEAPDGDVTVLWECTGGGVQGCSRLSIEGGSADINIIIIQQTGTMECVVPIATLTTLTTSIRSSTTVVYGVVETVLSTTRDMISTGTVEATGRPMTASTRSRQSAWNTTSSRSTSLSQAAPTGYPTVGLSNTGNASSNHPASAVNGSTMTLVVPVMEPTTTTRTTSLSTSTGGSLELPQTIVPLTSPGSCSNSAATA